MSSIKSGATIKLVIEDSKLLLIQLHLVVDNPADDIEQVLLQLTFDSLIDY